MPRNGQQLADLLKTDLDLAAGDERSDRSLAHLQLRFDLFGDAEARKQFGRQIHAAGARGVPDRFRAQQCLSKRVDRADVGPGRAGADRHPNLRAHEVDAAGRDHLSSCNQIVKRRSREDHHIRWVMPGEATGNRVCAAAHRCAKCERHRVSGGTLEHRRQLRARLGERARRHHAHVLGGGRPGDRQAGDDEGGDSSRATFNGHGVNIPQVRLKPDTTYAMASSKVRAIVRVSSGNFLEMYDFMVFGYYAPAIGAAFFPSGNQFVSLMLALMTFGAGFLMRPLGAIVLGAYADKHGRRAGLVLTLEPHVGRHCVDRVRAGLRHHRDPRAAAGAQRPAAAGIFGGHGARRRLGVPVGNRHARPQRVLRELAIREPASGRHVRGAPRRRVELARCRRPR